MPDFVHLHNHTHYSLLDGACSVNGLIEAAQKAGMPAVALTDHGVNFGLFEFYQKARKAGVKPIQASRKYSPTTTATAQTAPTMATGEIGPLDRAPGRTPMVSGPVRGLSEPRSRPLMALLRVRLSAMDVGVLRES